MFSQIKTEERDSCTVLKLSGQFIGGKETDDVKSALSKAGVEGVTKLIVDLGDVTYLNSTALGILISAHASFAKRDGKVVLCNVGKSIENIFVITKLTLVFAIKPTLSEAIEFLNNK